MSFFVIWKLTGKTYVCNNNMVLWLDTIMRDFLEAFFPTQGTWYVDKIQFPDFWHYYNDVRVWRGVCKTPRSYQSRRRRWWREKTMPIFFLLESFLLKFFPFKAFQIALVQSSVELKIFLSFYIIDFYYLFSFPLPRAVDYQINRLRAYWSWK